MHNTLFVIILSIMRTGYVTTLSAASSFSTTSIDSGLLSLSLAVSTGGQLFVTDGSVVRKIDTAGRLRLDMLCFAVL